MWLPELDNRWKVKHRHLRDSGPPDDNLWLLGNWYNDSLHIPTVSASVQTLYGHIRMIIICLKILLTPSGYGRAPGGSYYLFAVIDVVQKQWLSYDPIERPIGTRFYRTLSNCWKLIRSKSMISHSGCACEEPYLTERGKKCQNRFFAFFGLIGGICTLGVLIVFLSIRTFLYYCPAMIEPLIDLLARTAAGQWLYNKLLEAVEFIHSIV